MVRNKNKRMITHKEVNGWLDKQGKFDLDVFNMFIVTYYKEGTDPIKTGKTEIKGYLQDTETVVERVLDDGRDAYDKDKVLLYEINFGEWLTEVYRDVFGNGRVRNKSTRERVNDLWWGDRLTKASKNEIKQRLYAIANRNGNLVIRQEALRIEDERKFPPVTYAEALTHLRDLGSVNVTLDGVGSFDIWYEDDEYQSGYISEYKGNILYGNARAVLGATLRGVTDEDEDKVKKVKYKLL